MAPTEDRDEALRDRLRDCVDALSDRSIELLREALHAGDADERAQISAHEKRVTRARRAVEKAVGLLYGVADADE